MKFSINKKIFNDDDYFVYLPNNKEVVPIKIKFHTDLKDILFVEKQKELILENTKKFKENIKSNNIENDSNFSNDNLARKQNEILQSKEIRPKGELELEKFSKLVNLIEKKSEMVVAYHLKHSFRLVSFNEPKKIIQLEILRWRILKIILKQKKHYGRLQKYSKKLLRSVGFCQFLTRMDLRLYLN